MDFARVRLSGRLSAWLSLRALSGGCDMAPGASSGMLEPKRRTSVQKVLGVPGNMKPCRALTSYCDTPAAHFGT